jgi:hypothetical protein
MTAVLVPDDFRTLAEPFELDVDVDGVPVTVRLAVDSVDALPAHRLREQPFSLLLRGPLAPALPQATYSLRHPRWGTIELFLVPVERGAEKMRYEVLFN